MKLLIVGISLALLSAIACWLVVGGANPPAFNPSPNLEANREYREGLMALHERDDSLAAIGHFQAAIEKDPKFADAYARLAGAWISGSGATNIPKARLAAEKAVLLNRKLAVAHSILATVKLHELNWAGAEKERTLALKSNPNSEEILLESALNLAVMGKTNAALVILEKAHHANPDSASNVRVLLSGFVYAWCRQYDSAIEIYNQFPEGGAWMHEQHAQACLAKGNYTNAMRLGKLAALERGADSTQVNAEFDGLEKAFKQGGPRNYWELKLEFEKAKNGENHLMHLASIYARLNQPDKTFE